VGIYKASSPASGSVISSHKGRVRNCPKQSDYTQRTIVTFVSTIKTNKTMAKCVNVIKSSRINTEIYSGDISVSDYASPFFTSKFFLVNVRFEVFTAVTMKNDVFWDITPCGSCKNRRFGGT
jgi:hypothetical protein